MFKNIFRNKNVLVTGGGSGLGQAIALGFAKNCANVTIIGRDHKKLQDTQKCDSSISAYPLDIKNIEEVQSLFNHLKKNNNLPNILINNAAANFMCPSHKLSYNGYKSIIDTVLFGTLNMTMEAAKAKETDLVIGNITTTYAETGSKGVLPSAMAKAGVNSMIRTLAAEWGPRGIRTFGVAPGAIYTDGAFSRLDPEGTALKKLVETNPLRRMGTKDELVDLVLFLSQAGWINGEIVRMDGGELNENSGMFNKFI